MTMAQKLQVIADQLAHDKKNVKNEQSKLQKDQELEKLRNAKAKLEQKLKSLNENKRANSEEDFTMEELAKDHKNRAVDMEVVSRANAMEEQINLMAKPDQLTDGR